MTCDDGRAWEFQDTSAGWARRLAEMVLSRDLSGVYRQWHIVPRDLPS